jgi:hypothetical protein
MLEERITGVKEKVCRLGHICTSGCQKDFDCPCQSEHCCDMSSDTCGELDSCEYCHTNWINSHD